MKARPILLPTKDSHSKIEIDDKYINKLSYELKQYHCKNPQHIYLIDEEAEIEDGDWVYSSNSNSILQFKNKTACILANQQKEKYGNKTYFKIITSTDPSLVIDKGSVTGYRGLQEQEADILEPLPLLSEQSIKLLIDYYNKNGKMPENVDYGYEEPYLIYISIPEEKVYSRADIIHAFTSGHNKAKMGMTHSDALLQYKKEQNL